MFVYVLSNVVNSFPQGGGFMVGSASVCVHLYKEVPVTFPNLKEYSIGIHTSKLRACSCKGLQDDFRGS